MSIYQIWLFFKPDLEFGEWKYCIGERSDCYPETINNAHWMLIELPFSRYYVGDKLFFRGTLIVPETNYAKFTFFVDDCIERIYVNEQEAFYYPYCSSCTHCNGVEIDLSRFVKLGKNTIAIEVKNFKNTSTGFDVKKIEEISGLWVIIAILIGVLMAMKLRKKK
ncbi:MAG: hypothetical protein QW802_01275 [Candidatus Altiarchaeota archaeon]